MSSRKRNISFYFIYYPIYFILRLISFCPFFILYIFSDVLYFIVFYVVKYRRKVVRDNLKNCFSDLSNDEVQKIEKKFYHHFCDYFVETIKLFCISDKSMSKRMTFKNVEQLNDILSKDQSAILCIGHYGNWEWVTSLNLQFQSSDIKLCQVYKKISNDAFDTLFFKLRSRFKSDGIDKNLIYREIIRRRNANQKLLIGFIADQSPSIGNIHHWVNFLNRNTPVFVGIEKISKQTGFAVAYLDITKMKRGYYECEIKMITTDPKAEKEYYITDKYFSLLEKNILRAPEYWLWTHKRWKYKDQNEVDSILKRRNG